MKNLTALFILSYFFLHGLAYSQHTNSYPMDESLISNTEIDTVGWSTLPDDERLDDSKMEIYYDHAFESVVIDGIRSGDKLIAEIYDITGNRITGLTVQGPEKIMIPVTDILNRICYVSIETIKGKVVHKLYY